MKIEVAKHTMMSSGRSATRPKSRSYGLMVRTLVFETSNPGSNPGKTLIHRSLMVRIAGFHPADPGSIPGDEVGKARCPGDDEKAPKIVYCKKTSKIDLRSSPGKCRFRAICITRPVSSAW